MSTHPLNRWLGFVPIAMSLIVLLLIARENVFGLNPLPIHDEDANVDTCLLLIVGQVPIVLYFIYDSWREKKTFPVLALQLFFGATIVVTIWHFQRADQELVGRRISANMPLPGSEAALRRNIGDLQQGLLTHDSMSPTFNRYIDEYMPVVRKGLDSLGPLKSLDFKGVDHIGWDIYGAHFANGDLEWRIFVTSDGIIRGLTLNDGKKCTSSEVYDCRCSRAGGPPGTCREDPVKELDGPWVGGPPKVGE